MDVVVGSRVAIVPVHQLGDVLHFLAAHLHGWVVQRVVVEDPVELSPVVLHGLGAREEEEIADHCAQVTVGVSVPAVVVRFRYESGVTLGDAQVNGVPPSGVEDEKLRVESVDPFLLVDRVEGLEDLAAQELVVPIQNVEDFAVAAILMRGIVDVLHGCPVLDTFDKDPLLRIGLPPLQVSAGMRQSGIIGGIVDDDNPVVGVVLLKNRFYVPGIALACGVVVGGNHDTGHQLLLVVAVLVPLLVVAYFLVDYLLEFRVGGNILPDDRVIVQSVQKLLVGDALVLVHISAFTHQFGAVLADVLRVKASSLLKPNAVINLQQLPLFVLQLDGVPIVVLGQSLVLGEELLSL